MSDMYFDLKKYIEAFAFFEMFRLLSQTIQHIDRNYINIRTNETINVRCTYLS